MDDKSQPIKVDVTSAPGLAQESKLDRSIFFILLALAFLVPIFFIPQTLVEVSKSVLLSTLVTIMFFLWLVGRMKDGRFVFPKSLILLSAATLPVVFLVSGIFSQVPQVSLFGLGYETGTFATILILFLLMFLSSIFFQQQTRIFYLYSAFLVSFLLTFLYQMVVIIGVSFNFISSNILSYIPGNLIGKWTDLGTFFGFVLILSLVAVELITLRKALKVFLFVILTLSLVGLALINFYLLWIIVGLLSLVVLVYALSFGLHGGNESKNKTRKIPIASFVVLIISLLFVLGNGMINDFRNRVPILNIPNEIIRPSWQDTFEVGKASFLHDPVLGTGPNRFGNAWLSYKPASINQSPVLWNTDVDAGVGLVPTFAVTTGILGVLALLAFFGIFLYRGFTAILSVSVGKLSHYLLFSSFLGALYLWIIAIFYVPNIAILMLAFLMTGVFVAALAETGMGKDYNFSFLEDPRIGFVSVLVLVLLIIGSVAGGYTLFQKFLSVVFFERGLIMSSQGNLDGTMDSLGRAVLLNESDVYFRTLSSANIARLSLIISQKDVSGETIKQKFQEESRFAVGNALKARDLNPTDYQNWVALGNAYEALVPFKVQDAYGEAKKAYDQAIVLNPKSPALLLLRARIDVENNKEDAKTYIAKALSLKNDYTDAIFMLSQIQADEGNLDSAIASTEVASVLSPNSIGVYFQLGFLRYKNKDWDKAVSAFKRATELSPNYSNARYFLGLSYDKMGDRAKAIEQFEKIQELNPDNNEVKNILNNLRAGRDPFENQTVKAPEKQKQAPLKDN